MQPLNTESTSSSEAARERERQAEAQGRAWELQRARDEELRRLQAMIRDQQAPEPAPFFISFRPPAKNLSSEDDLSFWPSELPHTVTRDPANSNYDGVLSADDVADLDANGTHDLADVRAAIADPAWRAQVDGAYAALTTDQQADYDAVSAEIAHDPRATLALEEMLVDGELLTGSNGEGANILTALSEGTGSGTDTPWLADLVQELHDPQTISQGALSVCGAAALATQVATTDPAEYARLVVGLTVDGRVTTRSGAELVRDERMDDKLATLPENNRPSLGAGLLIEALMEISYPHGEYDPNRDGHEMLWGLITTPGTLPDEFAAAWSAVTGRPTEAHLFGLVHRDEEFAALTARVNSGEHVPAMISYSGSIHWVVVTGTDPDGTVHYLNPWGREESASSEEFQKNLMGSVYIN